MTENTATFNLFYIGTKIVKGVVYFRVFNQPDDHNRMFEVTSVTRDALLLKAIQNGTKNFKTPTGTAAYAYIDSASMFHQVFEDEVFNLVQIALRMVWPDASLWPLPVV